MCKPACTVATCLFAGGQNDGHRCSCTRRRDKERRYTPLHVAAATLEQPPVPQLAEMRRPAPIDPPQRHGIEMPAEAKPWGAPTLRDNAGAVLSMTDDATIETRPRKKFRAVFRGAPLAPGRIDRVKGNQASSDLDNVGLWRAHGYRGPIQLAPWQRIPALSRLRHTESGSYGEPNALQATGARRKSPSNRLIAVGLPTL